LAEGQGDAATHYLEEAISAVGRSWNLQALRPAHAVLAERDLLEGHPERVHARLLPLLDRLGVQELKATNLLPLLAWAHLELGEMAAAAELVAQAVTRAQAQDNKLALVDALRVAAMVALHQERRAAADTALVEGLDLARAMPHPYAEARLLHLYGDLHVQQGETALARERLEAALAIFQRLGARQDLERVERAIEELRSE
jgi:hypothetical protein